MGIYTSASKKQIKSQGFISGIKLLHFFSIGKNCRYFISIVIIDVVEIADITNIINVTYIIAVIDYNYFYKLDVALYR